MPVTTNQSSIAEVRDQLSLDYADGKYLDIVGSNLGINRPVFGFTDDVWRALVKELALDYKQIATKFHNVLAILFGPQCTVCSSLAQDSDIGATVIYLNNTDHLPQVGTIVLDGLTGAWEEVNYSYIDRVSGAVCLDSELTAAHASLGSTDASTGFLGYVAGSFNHLKVTNSSLFPTSGFPYTVVVGKETEQWEALLVTANDTLTNTLTLLVPPLNTHVTPQSTALYTLLDTDYASSSVFLQCQSVTQFPETGLVQIGSSNAFAVTSIPAADQLGVAASTFTDDRLVGYRIRFDGNTTAALAGKEYIVAANTDALVTLSASVSPAPVATDTFTVKPLMEYTGVDHTAEAIIIKRPLPDELAFPVGTRVDFMNVRESVCLATAYAAGADWDIIQVEPRVVELLLPEDLRDETALRTSSYLHTTEYPVVPATTVTTGSVSAATTIEVASTTTFPLVGVATFGVAVGSEERQAFYVSSPTELTIPYGLDNAHAIAEDIELYQPAHASTEVLIGDDNQTVATFPGPYVYNISEDAPTGTVSLTGLPNGLPGPTRILMSQRVSGTALEVEDASTWERATLPYNIHVGSGTGNFEVVEVNDVNFRDRTFTTVASPVGPGDTTITVAAVSLGAAGDAADFPNVNGYRVRVGTEVVYVTGVSGSDLLLESPTTSSHIVSTPVELVADVLSVTSLDDSHTGEVDRPFRSAATSSTYEALYPVVSTARYDRAELAQPLIESFDVDDATGLDINGGTVILNFGYSGTSFTTTSVAVASGSGPINVAAVGGIPTTGEFVVTISPGTFIEEKVLVSSVSGTSLILDFDLKNTHPFGAKVKWEPGIPESLNYSSIIGNTVSFSSPIVLQSAHSNQEVVIDSSAESDPKLNGFDYPFRLPPDILTRIQFVLDLIRAAGVQVTPILQR